MESALKNFSCIDHPDELIQRVSFNPNATKNLYCISCLIEGKPQGELHSFQEYFNKFINYQKRMQNENQEPVGVPDEIQILFAQREEMTGLLWEHIEQEKVQVHNFFDDYKQRLLTLLEEARLSAIRNLDDQLKIMSSNYDQLQAKVKLLSENINIYRDVDDLFATTNRFSSTQDLKQFIQFLNSQVNELKVAGSMNKSKYQGVFEGVHSMMNWNENSRPVSSFSSQKIGIEASIENLETLLDQVSLISNPITQLNLSNPFSSNILENYQEVKLISEWICKKKAVELKKVFQGSTSDINHSVILKASSQVKNMLFLIKTNLDEKIGVFTNVQFNSAPNMYEGKRMFFFNLSEETKFTTHQPIPFLHLIVDQNTIRFGNELMISANSHGALNQFRCTWKNGVKVAQSELTQAPQFKVKAIEIYDALVDFDEDSDSESILKKPKNLFGSFNGPSNPNPSFNANPKPSSGFFGSNPQPSVGFGSSPSGGLFNPKPPTGLFGNLKPSGSGGFGSNPNPSNATTSSNPQITGGAGTGLFNASKPSGGSGGLFGNGGNSSSGLFKSAGGLGGNGLFQSAKPFVNLNPNPSGNQESANLKPAGTGLFGSKPSGSSGLFGSSSSKSSSNRQTTGGTGTGLFNACKPSGGSGGLFGNGGNSSSGLFKSAGGAGGNGLFQSAKPSANLNPNPSETKAQTSLSKANETQSETSTQLQNTKNDSTTAVFNSMGKMGLVELEKDSQQIAGIID